MGEEERKLVAAVTKLEELLASLQAVRSRRDAERGKALVALRRQLSTQVAEIAALARPLLDRRGDMDGKEEFRRLHSALLTKLALHQATWPAVRLVNADDAADYTLSARTVDQAASAVIRCLRSRIGRNQPS